MSDSKQSGPLSTRSSLLAFAVLAVAFTTTGCTSSIQDAGYAPSNTYSDVVSLKPAAPYTSGGATASDPRDAFEGSLSGAALFDGGPFAATVNFGGNIYRSSAITYYGGFPAIALDRPAALSISYRDLQGLSTSGGILNYGGFAAVNTYVGQDSQFGVIQSAANTSAGIVSFNPAEGTATIPVPAGTELSTIFVGIDVGDVTDSTHNAFGGLPGHIEITRIWIE